MHRISAAWFVYLLSCRDEFPELSENETYSRSNIADLVSLQFDVELK
jgi:hypothetical protein